MLNPDSSSWTNRESGILALGAVANGCFHGLESHLPRLVPYLIQLIQDTKVWVVWYFKEGAAVLCIRWYGNFKRVVWYFVDGGMVI